MRRGEGEGFSFDVFIDFVSCGGEGVYPKSDWEKICSTVRDSDPGMPSQVTGLGQRVKGPHLLGG